MLNSLTHFEPARLSRPVALSMCVLAGIACLWLLVRLGWLVLAPTDDNALPPPQAAAAAAVPAQSLAKWHLFGNPQTVNLAQMRNAPATTLKLILRGTLALPDPKQGMAVIADEHGSERAYSIGDDVTDGAKLAEVYTDHAVLTHEGVAETLNMPRPEQHAPELPEANQRALAGSPANPKASSVPPTFVPPQTGHGALDWSKAQRQLQLDPAELAKQVHVEPVFENGKIAGARLSGGGDVAALMREAGLKPTDLITAVNGSPISGLSNPQQFMDNLRNAASLQVTVLRDGKPATLTLNLR